MIIDSTGTDCQTVNFNIGADTTTSRSWDIYVTQYTCGQEDLAGYYLLDDILKTSLEILLSCDREA